MSESSGTRPGGVSVSPTGWALLGLLSSGTELSGYDIKKWFNWAIRLFYSPPAYSQIYSELKRFEQQGLVSSRVDGGVRNRRMYKITDAGLSAVTSWANEEPVEPPTLKHNPLLRVTLGHLAHPGRLKEILTEHVAYAEQMQQTAATEARWTGKQPAWAYANLALRWTEQYYAAERDLTLQMIEDLDEVESAFAGRPEGAAKFPVREYWYEVEQGIAAEHRED